MGANSVTRGADDLAFGDLVSQGRLAAWRPRHFDDVARLLAAHVVKLQNLKAGITTIGAGVGGAMRIGDGLVT